MTPEDRMKKLGSAEASSPTEAEWLEFRQKAHESVARRRFAAIAGGTVVLLAIVGGAYAVTRTPSDTPRPPVVSTPSPSDTETPETPLGPEDQKLPMPTTQWYFETDGKLTPFPYFLYKPVSPRRLLAQTIEIMPGPLGETGVTSAIPIGTQLTYLSFDGRTAQLVVRGEGPSGEEELRKAHAQIVYTATQFDGIERVDLTWRGRESKGLTREDFHDLLPVIAVEEPYAPQEVHRFIHLKGIANVYEGTVSWRLTSLDGEVFKEGFTTATCGNGCWGAFEDRISLEGVPTGRVVLEVFQVSAEDGSPMNQVDIPIDVVATGTEERDS